MDEETKIKLLALLFFSPMGWICIAVTITSVAVFIQTIAEVIKGDNYSVIKAKDGKRKRDS